jgi:hypothetical protein
MSSNIRSSRTINVDEDGHCVEMQQHEKNGLWPLRAWAHDGGSTVAQYLLLITLPHGPGIVRIPQLLA